MKKNYFLLAAVTLLMSVQAIFAQNRSAIDVNQVLVVSGGVYSDPDDFVNVAAYKPNEDTTTDFNTIFSQSVQCAVVFDHFLYVAAQDSIVAYDIDTYERVAVAFAAGVNQLAVTEDKLIASFWYPDTSNFVKIFNRSDLTEQAVITEVSDEAAGIAVYENKAYVAVPGGWDATSGKLAVIDLENNAFVEEVDLGAEGAGINNVYVYEDGDLHSLVTINKTAWGGTAGYITKIDLADMSFASIMVDVVLGKGVGFVNDDATLYALINGGIGSINVADVTVADTVIVAAPAMSIAGAAYDKVHLQFYITTTDYASVGEGIIYSMDGVATGNFDAGIAAEAIAIDYRDFEGVKETYASDAFAFYPNPTSGQVTIANPDRLAVEQIVVSDLTGRVVMTKSISETTALTVDLSGLNNGMYLVSVISSGKIFTTKFVKQ